MLKIFEGVINQVNDLLIVTEQPNGIGEKRRKRRGPLSRRHICEEDVHELQRTNSLQSIVSENDVIHIYRDKKFAIYAHHFGRRDKPPAKNSKTRRAMCQFAKKAYHHEDCTSEAHRQTHGSKLRIFKNQLLQIVRSRTEERSAHKLNRRMMMYKKSSTRTLVPSRRKEERKQMRAHRKHSYKKENLSSSTIIKRELFGKLRGTNHVH
ncbi:hypothetical protein SNEBB_002325 [Seison nebaliae]|nr:hypothetical protein SNEBB_002325 [Seison nebaliae]